MTPLAILCLVSVAVAFPQQQQLLPAQFAPQPLQQTAQRSPITSVVREFQSDDATQFTLNHQSSDGQVNQETLYLVKTADGTDYVPNKKGYYSYLSPEGVPVQIKWSADETGFHAEGDVIPVPVKPIQPTF